MKTRILALLIASSLATLAHTASAENLLQVYQQAKGHDAQFKAQESSHLAILEKRQQALAALKPQVSLSGKAAYNESRDTLTNNATVNGDAANYTLQMGKSLFNKGISANIGKTDAVIGQSTAALESYRQDLIMRVADAYFKALLAQENVIFAGAEKDAISHQLEQTQAYFDAGRSAITDVKEAEASYAASVAQEINATQQLDIARELLRVQTGGFYPNLLAPRNNMPLSVPTPNSIEAWVNTAKQNNHLLRASKYGITAAQKEVEAQRAGRYPTLDLYANHTGSYLDNDVYKNRRTNDSAIGLSVSVPLYTGGATSSKIREAQDKFQQAQQEYDLQGSQTEQQTRSAFLTVQSSISQVEANKQALAAAETAAEATQAGFEVGTRTAVDVLNSLRNVFKARRDYASARYTYLQSTLTLRQAAGTLNDKDVASISAFMTEAPKQVAMAQDTPAPEAADDTKVEVPAVKSKAKPASAPAPVEGKKGKAAASEQEYYVMPDAAK
ncbi:MAG: TolC family outer membrane protein [Thiothrix sp.]|uniref:TolC family outer membrane protein n=1 Tax=Thiothrix sp. TaxID=1032 RepID=UPI002601A4E7|nr:TolC family outer membrane protein [Thiothrix sp.]MDD5391629.1 TolC family outer membrane protein [Thiothrix sp.]